MRRHARQLRHRALAGEHLELRAMLTAPVAFGDYFTTNQSTPLPITTASLLANDHDAENDQLDVALIAERGPPNGTLTFRASGELVYTPNPGFFGDDSFRYYAWDGQAFSDEPVAAMIHVEQVIPPSHTSGVVVGTIGTTDWWPSFDISLAAGGPIAVNDFFVLAEDSFLTTAAPGVLANDRVTAGSAWTVVLESTPEHGTLTLAADGSFTFAPHANYFGDDRFTYRITDGQTTSNLATVRFEITPVNDVPEVADDHFATPEDVPLPMTTAALLANDVDVDGDSLTIVLVVGRGPQHGTLTVSTAAELTYTPDPDYLGEDAFEYSARDAEVFSAQSAVVEVDVTAVPGEPRHNDRIPHDVSNDAEVSPLDALLIINLLNRADPNSFAPEADAGEVFYDVSGDGWISPLDALLVINLLNARTQVEGESAAAAGSLGSEIDPPASSFLGPSLRDIADALAYDAWQSAKRKAEQAAAAAAASA